MSRPDAPEPGVTLPANFSTSGTEAVGDRWWREFGDGQLNGLVSRALQGNFSLQSAAARLRQAEAVLQRAQSDLGPDVEGSLSGTVLDDDLGRVGDGSADFGLGLGASYEVDLWGGIRARVDAEEFRARATREDYQTAALTLSAEVTRRWFQLVEAREQLALVREQIATNEKVVQSLENRFVEGQNRAVDVLRQRQLLEGTREVLTVAELQEEVLSNQLAVLLGRAPGTGGVPAGGELSGLPNQPRTGLPLQLLARRPDVRADFELIRAADAEVAAAMTDRFPRLALTADSSGVGNNPSALFSNWASQIGFDLIAPIVDSGERKAEVERTRAVLQERLANYRETVVQAIGEVENALARERKQRERIARLEGQVSLAERSLQQLQRQFINGVGDFIDVLTAFDDEQELRRNLLTARRELLEFRIALYRSLAGGFELARNDFGTT
jgi:NodT family efflux transporter outer membrane factor (OMF) lipoprotein